MKRLAFLLLLAGCATAPHRDPLACEVMRQFWVDMAYDECLGSYSPLLSCEKLSTQFPVEDCYAGIRRLCWLKAVEQVGGRGCSAH